MRSHHVWSTLAGIAGPRKHFLVTLMALGASPSIVNILSANSWMQHPVAADFDYMHLLVRLKSILRFIKMN